jgi:hypothetical protein
MMQQNILLNFPDFPMPITTIEEIREAMNGHRVILVADQWNSIDDDYNACNQARECLDKCLGSSVRVTIQGLSMNAKTWHELLFKRYSGDLNTYYGGFQDNEFEVWLRRQPKMFTEHKEELALLTGKVPSLLSVFERAYNLDRTVSWEQVLLNVQKDSLLRDWKSMLTKFYSNVAREDMWRVLTQSIDWYADDSIIDHRFFYEDSNKAIVATSEIILQLLYQIWSNQGTDDTILSTWPELGRPRKSIRSWLLCQTNHQGPDMP